MLDFDESSDVARFEPPRNQFADARRLRCVVWDIGVVARANTVGYESHRTRTSYGAPADAHLIGCRLVPRLDHLDWRLYFIYTHPSFASVEPGAFIPVDDVTLMRLSV